MTAPKFDKPSFCVTISPSNQLHKEMLECIYDNASIPTK